MEAIASIAAFLCLIVVAAALFFMLVVQPIWSIVSMAVSPRLSSGAKAALIVLSLVLLGPLLTFFYALFGTESKALRVSTIVGAIIVVVSAAAFFGLAAVSESVAPHGAALVSVDSGDVTP